MVSHRKLIKLAIPSVFAVVVLTFLGAELLSGNSTTRDRVDEIQEAEALPIETITDDAQIAEPNTSAGDVDESAIGRAVEEKGRISLQMALSLPEVAKYTEQALAVDHEFYAAEMMHTDGIAAEDDLDILNIHVATKQTVTGDWRTSQVRTMYGLYDIEVTFKQDRLTDKVIVTPLPDRQSVITFTDREKEIIGAAAEDYAPVRGALEQRGGDANVYVLSVYEHVQFKSDICPEGSCAVVNFVKTNTKEVMRVWVNIDTLRVARVAMTEGF